MEQIKLEVGKRYEVRDVEYAIKKNIDPHVTIEAEEHGSIYPFLGNDGSWYAADGRLFFGADGVFDLVKEVLP